MGDIYRFIVARGARVVGAWPADDHAFIASKTWVNGAFVSLVLDQENQKNPTDARGTSG
ncbi:MAG: hypothetical protein AAB278_00370 [Pseudomonadota bacterium]